MKYKNYIIIVALSLFFLLMGAWLGNDTLIERQLLDRYATDSETKQFVEQIGRDKKDLASHPDPSKRIAATMDMGLQWYLLGEHTRAAEWWERGLALNADNEVGWNNLGNAYRILKRYGDADRAYRESIRTAQQGELAGCLSLGEMYRVDIPEKKTEEASVYHQCLIKNPNDRDLIARLAVYYRDVGDRKNAVIYFQKLVDLEPGNGQAFEELRKFR